LILCKNKKKTSIVTNHFDNILHQVIIKVFIHLQHEKQQNFLKLYHLLVPAGELANVASILILILQHNIRIIPGKHVLGPVGALPTFPENLLTGTVGKVNNRRLHNLALHILESPYHMTRAKPLDINLKLLVLSQIMQALHCLPRLQVHNVSICYSLPLVTWIHPVVLSVHKQLILLQLEHVKHCYLKLVEIVQLLQVMTNNNFLVLPAVLSVDVTLIVLIIFVLPVKPKLKRPIVSRFVPDHH
jgi:hypothetical protein